MTASVPLPAPVGGPAVHAERAPVAVGFLAGRGIDVDAVEVDRAARVGGHALEPGPCRGLAGADYRQAAGAEQAGVDRHVGRAGAGPRVDRSSVADGVGGHVGARGVSDEDAGVGDAVADLQGRLPGGIGKDARPGAGIVHLDRLREPAGEVGRPVVLRAPGIVDHGRVRARNAHREARCRGDGCRGGIHREPRVRGVGPAEPPRRIVEPHPRAGRRPSWRRCEARPSRSRSRR